MVHILIVNPYSGTETFYTVTYENFKQRKIQCLVYLLQMINNSGLHAVQWQQMSIDAAAPKSI